MLRESLEATVTRKLGYVLSRDAYSDFRSASTTPNTAERRCWA